MIAHEALHQFLAKSFWKFYKIGYIGNKHTNFYHLKKDKFIKNCFEIARDIFSVRSFLHPDIKFPEEQEFFGSRYHHYDKFYNLNYTGSSIVGALPETLSLKGEGAIPKIERVLHPTEIITSGRLQIIQLLNGDLMNNEKNRANALISFFAEVWRKEDE